MNGSFLRLIRNIESFTCRIQQLERNATDTDSIAKTVTTSEDSPSRVKKLRSADPTSQTVKSNQQNQHVLPALCIFCKTEKTIVDKATKKRNKEDLRNCELIENEKLLCAARAKGHVELLRQVEGKDLVSTRILFFYCIPACSPFLFCKMHIHKNVFELTPIVDFIVLFHCDVLY